MEFFALVFLALGLTISCYIFRKSALAFAAALGWFVFALYCFNTSTSGNPAEITDIYMGMFWLGIGLTIVSAFEPLIMKQPNQLMEDEEVLTDDEKMANEYEKMHKEMTGYRHIFKGENRVKKEKEIKPLSMKRFKRIIK